MATEEEIVAEVRSFGRLSPHQEDVLYGIALKQDELGRESTCLLLEDLQGNPLYEPLIEREYLTFDTFDHGGAHRVASLYVTSCPAATASCNAGAWRGGDARGRRVRLRDAAGVDGALRIPRGALREGTIRMASGARGAPRAPRGVSRRLPSAGRSVRRARRLSMGGKLHVLVLQSFVRRVPASPQACGGLSGMRCVQRG